VIYANDPFGMKIKAAPGVEGWCPACQEKMVAKCGEIKIWHWSHIGGTDCDEWHEPMTRWHIDWQENFPFDLQEVVIAKPSGSILCEDSDETHRADVRLSNGVVLEFQHSPISPEEIKQRELFYQRMIWVFDVIEPYQAGRFHINRKQGFDTFTWKQSRKSISACARAVVFDLGGEVFTVSKLYPATASTLSSDKMSYNDSKPMGGWGRIQTHHDFIAWLKGGKLS
jgi:hypothetical protein